MGAGHVPGILEHIRTDTDIAPLEQLPPKGRAGRVLKWVLPAAIFGTYFIKYQVEKIGKTLNPECMAESSTTDTGAPFINENGEIEAGHGRKRGLDLTYTKYGEKGAEYKKWLTDNKARFGLDDADIEAMDKPVLVRIRKTDIKTQRNLSSSQINALPPN